MQEKKERLQKILSANGVASRREAERMIAEGRILVNGAPAILGQLAQLGVDDISVDGISLSPLNKRIYLMLNKPCGYLTTVKDERGRKTVMELITDVNMRVFPVGRLDLDSQGLLLFTNDGEFANMIMHPSFNKHKTYEVEVKGDAYNAARLMRNPIEIDGHTVKACSVILSKATETGGILRITLAEGRNRQVRKMCKECGVSVTTLKRLSIGELELGELKSGQWRYLTNEEVSALGEGYIACN